MTINLQFVLLIVHSIFHSVEFLNFDYRIWKNMEAYSIFIVEDDAWYGQLLQYHLSLNPDFEVSLYETAEALLKDLYKKPDVVCMDFGLPDMEGRALFEKIQSQNNKLPIVVISAQSDISVAVELLKLGASDYIVKDDNTKELLWTAIHRIKEHSQLKEEVQELKQQLEEKFSFDKSIIGQSKAIKSTFSMLQNAVRTNINVSITGETGTGKELVAKAVHFNSDRKKKPFVAVNMGSIPSELLESELFGHEKGAFTGALARKKGKFEEANGGTLFLDEIAELDLNMQSKLLRVLQERELVRVGGNEIIKLDIRLIIATHKNLAEEVRNGNFREDLFYRVMGLPVELPPLRERDQDILILAKHFMDLFCKENKLGSLSLSQEAMDKLMRYNFPGNVRELKAMIDLACVMSRDEVINAQDIIFPAVKQDETFTAIEKTLREYNADIISFFLKKYNRNVVLVADKLGVGKSTIYNMINSKEIMV